MLCYPVTTFHEQTDVELTLTSFGSLQTLPPFTRGLFRIGYVSASGPYYAYDISFSVSPGENPSEIKTMSDLTVDLLDQITALSVSVEYLKVYKGIDEKQIPTGNVASNASFLPCTQFYNYYFKREMILQSAGTH